MKRQIYWLARGFIKILFKIYFRITLYGKKNIPETGPFILVCNHQSLLDPVLCGIFTDRQLYYLGRDTLFGSRFSHWFFHAINVIPIKRDSASLSGIKVAIKKIKSGNGLCVFPEGTRSHDGRIADFKPGFSLICRYTRAKIVPVIIDGAFECWPRNGKIIKPGRIYICFDKAIPPDQIENINDNELVSMLQNTIRQLQTGIRIRNGKEPFNYN